MRGRTYLRRTYLRRTYLRRTYLVMAVAGFALPYGFLVSFLIDHGPDPALFLRHLFATDVSTFFAVDLILTAVVFLLYLHGQAREGRVTRPWLIVVATLAVGPSFAFPLFLYLRETCRGRASGA